MSYSFQVRAATKALALAAVQAEFAKVVAQQPVHVRDEAAVIANAVSVVGLVADDDTKDVVVTVNGYLSWQSAEAYDVAPLTNASVSASAYLALREQA